MSFFSSTSLPLGGSTNDQTNNEPTMATPATSNTGVGHGLDLANATDVTIICAGSPVQQFIVHSSLLVQSSKWFERELKVVQSDQAPSENPNSLSTGKTAKSIQMPPPHTPGAVDIFVKYLYQKDVVPHTDSFAQHGIKAFLLSQLLESPDFTRCCERALEHALEKGDVRPSLQQLQTIRGITDLSSTLDSQLLENIANRMIDFTYPFHKGDESAIDGWTWRALCSRLAAKADKNKSIPARTGFSFGRYGDNIGPMTGTWNSTPASGLVTTSSVGGLNSANNSNQNTGSFGSPAAGNNTQSLFGRNNTTTGGLFGQSQYRNSPSDGAPGGSLFGNSTQPTANNSSCSFGCNRGRSETPGGLFGNASETTRSTIPGFGSHPSNNSLAGGVPGNNEGKDATNSGFSSQNPNNTLRSGSLFGSAATNIFPETFGAHQAQSQRSSNLFGHTTGTNSGGLFGQNAVGPNSHYQPQHSTSFGSYSGFGNAGGSTAHTTLAGFGSNSFGGFGNISGTESTAFTPFTEKESNGTTSVYQNICAKDPYPKISWDELRLADYNNNRQFGHQQLQQPSQGSGCTNLSGRSPPTAIPLHTLNPAASLEQLISQVTSQRTELNTLNNKIARVESLTSRLLTTKGHTDSDSTDILRELKEQLTRIEKDTEAIKAKQGKQEQQISSIIDVSRNEDADSPAASVIFTPTSSAATSPSGQAAIPTDTGPDDFVNVESETTAPGPVRKVHFANENNNTTAESSNFNTPTNKKGKSIATPSNLENEADLSNAAREIYEYLKEQGSPLKYIDISVLAETVWPSEDEVLVAGMELARRGLIDFVRTTSKDILFRVVM